MTEPLTNAGRQILADVGVVIIGRNEGERLVQCLRSTTGRVAEVVYVDSGSTDASIARARSIGARVVELDMAQPFTAARARNAGFARLLEVLPHARFVQFVDGDCELVDGWLKTARDHLAGQPGVAAVFGRRRERYPDASIYNALTDDEWNVPPGEVSACGGDVMIDVAALRDVGGYRETLIAGEEPELCIRLRRNGLRIVCLAAEMTRHDAALHHFSQWWRRRLRGGHAFAEGAFLHGAPPERHWVRESRRVWAWGAVVPALIMAGTLAFGSLGLAAALIYPAQIARLYARYRAVSPVPFATAFFQVIGNFPEMLGQLRFHRNRLRGRTGPIIEYK